MALLERENRKLKKRLGTYRLERDRYNEALGENQRLRLLLGFKQQTGYEAIPAEIIGMGTAGLPGSVHLDVGWKDGCRKNMVIVSHEGVVGRLVSIGRNASVGQLMTDPSFRISGKVQRSRVLGIVRWLYGNICVLEGVPGRGDVQVGDRVVTSGFSRIYPPGLVIGRVFKISPHRNGLFQNILLRTEEDFTSLEEVFVLREISNSDVAPWEQ
jgi:rod shape-determining protein MreC